MKLRKYQWFAIQIVPLGRIELLTSFSPSGSMGPREEIEATLPARRAATASATGAATAEAPAMMAASSNSSRTGTAMQRQL